MVAIQYQDLWPLLLTGAVISIAVMAGRLGPELLGDGWKGRMRLAVNLALQRGSLERWQEEAIDKCV